MKKVVFLLTFAALMIACSEPSENNMIVSGNVKGLKKGTLYLQKIKDSVLISIDSMVVKGDGNFEFEYKLDSPELFYLYLDKADNNDINDRITFFGERGPISITTTWNSFDSDAKISGSTSHEQFEKCYAILSKFNTRDLELAQQEIAPEFQNESSLRDSLRNLSDKNLLRRYQYVLNFALTNPDSYVSPYLALTEAADANPKYLDSISNALNKEVSNSKYGGKLKEYLEALKN